MGWSSVCNFPAKIITGSNIQIIKCRLFDIVSLRCNLVEDFAKAFSRRAMLVFALVQLQFEIRSGVLDPSAALCCMDSGFPVLVTPSSSSQVEGLTRLSPRSVASRRDRWQGGCLSVGNEPGSGSEVR